jgi:hypothetical protein
MDRGVGVLHHRLHLHHLRALSTLSWEGAQILFPSVTDAELVNLSE